jgi:hypothetical protein
MGLIISSDLPSSTMIFTFLIKKRDLNKKETRILYNSTSI